MKNDELTLHSMKCKDGKLDIKKNGGKNFLTLTVNDSENKYAINIQNCNGIDTPAEKLQRMNDIVDSYKDMVIDLARTVQRLEKADLTVDDIKLIWKLKIALGEPIPTSIEEGTRSLILKETNSL